MPESSSIPGPGSRLGQYEIVRTAGVGGMGVVYLAHDPDLERDVAIKLLKAPKDSAAAPDAEAAERFLREARSAARLNHPNTVAVYQVGRHEGLVFIAMEWVDGGSMAEHLRHHLFLDWREATAAVRDAAAGLAAAHRAGIVHRDLKPANLMRTRGGVVKVTDFGLARVLDAKSELTHAGTILGTPAYLSPEQCRGEPATIASDVYALGCAFFTLLTSRPPYDAPNLPGMLHCHLNTPFPDARMFADDIPEAVLSIVERSTRKDPASRYPSADVMLADLEAALGDRPIAAALPETIVTPPPDGFEAAVAPGPTAPPPNNLPEPTTSFVGRTRELAEARDLLGRHRLVTLLGPGGTGKTRLSLKLARDVLPLFPGGAWQVELAALTGETADAVPQAIAAALGVRAPAGRPALGAVIEWLGDKACLLILDNCEHLIDASADAAAALLKQCAGARIIATSRQPLGVAGEVELRVPALAAPASGVIGPAELAEVDAVRLFVDRAAQARPGFALVMDNAAAVADICRRLDGIPLAIELAAARVKALAPAQIAARLTDAFGLLTTGPRTVLPRQRTLRALIDWSYDLLAPDERTVLARLSVFAGSWALESAEAVVAGGDVDAGAVMDVLAGLVDKSLVVMDERGGEARYRMLETIRQYAAEKLEASGERGEVEGRHLEHFATFTTEVMPKLWGPEQAQWLARSDLEVDNVRAALDRGLRDPARLSRAADLAAAAYQHWLMRGLVTEGLARLEALIAAGATAGEPTRTRVRLLVSASVMHRYAGAADRARARAAEGLAMATALGEPELECTAGNNAGTLARDAGDYETARGYLERTLAVRRTLGDLGAVADAVNNLGILLSKIPAERPAARALLEESLALFEQTGNASWVGYGNMNIGEIDIEDGDMVAARARYGACLKIVEALGDEWGVAYALVGLGECDLAEGQFAAARARFERAVEMCRKLGDKAGMALPLDRLAKLAARAGDDADGAWDLGRQSMAIRLCAGDKPGVAESLQTLAMARVGSDPGRAAELLGCADEQRRRVHVAASTTQAVEREQLVEGLREALGEEELTRRLTAGAGLDPAALE